VFSNVVAERESIMVGGGKATVPSIAGGLAHVNVAEVSVF
jgi:hypothetical protein